LRRWLATEGKFGEPPEDYALFAAAKYCNVAPWVLAEQSVWWQNKALDYLSAEGEAQEIINERNRKK
jgi:hypothetical protein